MPERMIYLRADGKNEYVAHVGDSDQVYLQKEGDLDILHIVHAGDLIPEEAQLAYMTKRSEVLQAAIGRMLEPKSVSGFQVHKVGRKYAVYQMRRDGSLNCLHGDLKRRQARNLARTLEEQLWNV